MPLTIGMSGQINVTFHAQCGAAGQHVPTITMDFRQKLFRNKGKIYGGVKATITVASGWSLPVSV